MTSSIRKYEWSVKISIYEKRFNLISETFEYAHWIKDDWHHSTISSCACLLSSKKQMCCNYGVFLNRSETFLQKLNRRSESSWSIHPEWNSRKMRNFSYRLSVIHQKMTHNCFNTFISNRTNTFMFSVLNRAWIFEFLNGTHHSLTTHWQFYMILIENFCSNTCIIT